MITQHIKKTYILNNKIHIYTQQLHTYTTQTHKHIYNTFFSFSSYCYKKKKIFYQKKN